MQQVWKITLKTLIHVSLGMGLGTGLVMVSPSMANPYTDLQGRSLEELQIMRTRLIQELESPVAPSPKSFFLESFFPNKPLPNPEIIIPKLQIIEAKILSEKQANDHWRVALNLAKKAQELEQSNPKNLNTREKITSLWQQALNNLKEIPSDSLMTENVVAKKTEYQANLQQAITQFKQAKSAVLAEIATASGLSSDAMISVCRFSRDCVHLRGEILPDSPASLIKVPIAIAVMEKVKSQKISLDEKVYVHPGNFTEDASSIRSRQAYPLKQLVGEMIDHSSNIATNELIDYLGSNYINEVLARLGYETTRVNFKLMGDRIMPFQPGKGKNRLTSDELTEMMVKIYNQETPGSKLLKEALARQYDRQLGFAALEGKKSAQWLGEKTGENSRVLGTTVALNIKGEGYIITVIDNHNGIDPLIRNCIAKIADYIIDNGPL